MIFVQLFSDNFLSHTYTIILFSLIIFISLLFFTNKKREKENCHTNFYKLLYKYHYPSTFQLIQKHLMLEPNLPTNLNLQLRLSLKTSLMVTFYVTHFKFPIIPHHTNKAMPITRILVSVVK